MSKTSLFLNINYYDENSTLSCKIFGDISLKTTKLASKLYLVVTFNET